MRKLTEAQHWPQSDVCTQHGTTYSDLCEAELGSEMEIRVALLLVVWIAQVVRVVAHDTLHQRQVVQHYGATQAPRYINPGQGQHFAIDEQYTAMPLGHTYISMLPNHGLSTRRRGVGRCQVGVGCRADAGRRELMGELRTSAAPFTRIS